jgi:phytoene synthase
MNLPHAVTSASYGVCRGIARRSKSSFYAGFALLPREKRRAMDALYAFMRHTDDLADCEAPAKSRRELLLRWRDALRRAVAGDFSTPEDAEPLPPEDLELDLTGTLVLPALVDAVRRFQIPLEHLHAVIDGVEMDLTRTRYETFAELELYCQRVASAVGLACIYVWGFRGEGAFEPARQCGLAVQLTNILRDVKEDAARGRVYLPLEDVRACGAAVEDLLDGVAGEPVARLVAMEVARAESFYREGARLAEFLEPDGRRIFGLMTATYRALLRKIAARPHAILSRRVRLGAAKKLQLALRWLLFSP